jgi:PAS domain S-box-containing protein
MAQEPPPGPDIQRLSHELHQLQEFLDGLPDAMFDIDFATNRVSAINTMMTIVMGYTREDIDAGLPAFQLAPPDEARRFAERSQKYIAAGIVRGGGRYKRTNSYETVETRLIRRDGSEFDAEFQAAFILDQDSMPVGMRVIVRDISQRKAAERAHQELIERLQQALDEVKTLRGLIPICAWCKSIRDDAGYWRQLESFLKDHSHAEFTHGICEACAQRLEDALPAADAPAKARSNG